MKTIAANDLLLSMFGMDEAWFRAQSEKFWEKLRPIVERACMKAKALGRQNGRQEVFDALEEYAQAMYIDTQRGGVQQEAVMRALRDIRAQFEQPAEAPYREPCAHFNQQGGRCPYGDDYIPCAEKCCIRRGEA